MTPACFNTSRSISSTPTAASSYRRTCAVSALVSETKPRLGRRRCIGIWPPSKPTLWKPPARDFWPLWPRPAVLPRPEPMPRPTRRLACLAPVAGLIELSCICCSSSVGALQHLHQVGNLVDHAAHRGGVLQHALAVELAQAEAAHGVAVRGLAADRAADQLDLQGLLGIRHQSSPAWPIS